MATQMTCDSGGHAQRGDAKQAPSEADLWRPIQGYEGRYSVSRDGRVFSYIRDLEMKPVANSSGYATVQLQARRHRVHRLVCAAFNGPPNALHRHVAHLNGDKTDNRADNLKWVSPAENDSHKDRHGTRQSGANHPRAKLTQEQVDEIRRSPASGAQLARLFGVNKEAISKVRLGHRWGQSGGATSAASPNLQGEDIVEELKPCPFCDDPMVREARGFGHTTVYQDRLPMGRRCFLRHTFYPDALIAAWNTRPQSITVTEEMIEAGARQLYKDYENTTDGHVEIIFTSTHPACRSLADEMREWFKESMHAALSKVSPLVPE